MAFDGFDQNSNIVVFQKIHADGYICAVRNPKLPYSLEVLVGYRGWLRPGLQNPSIDYCEISDKFSKKSLTTH
jgi:hypothetical protein